MAEMRIPESLRCQHLNDFSYTWDETYNKLLLRNDLATNHSTTDSTALSSIPLDSYGDNIFDFILPWKYKYRTILDGTARGSVKFDITAYANTGQTTTYAYVVITLLAITSAGVETTLGTATTGTKSVQDDAGGAATTSSHEIPFWMNIDNQIIDEDNKLVLRVNVKAKYTETGSTTSVSGTLYHAKNADDTFIEVPLVP